MALPNDFFANGNNGSPGADLPALTPQWMLSRSSSSTLESRTEGALQGGGAEDTTWRGSSAKDKGPLHFTPRYGDTANPGRGSRWREEERDGRRELGRWNSTPIGGDLLDSTKSLGLGANGPGGNRWDPPYLGRGRGGGSASEIWGGGRFGGKGDRWDGSELPGMTGSTRPNGPGSRFPTSGDPRPLADPKLDSWRSSTTPSLSGAPPSLSGFVVPGSQAQGQSDGPLRPGAMSAGRGRGFTIGRGRGIKPPASQSGSAFLEQHTPRDSKGKDKNNSLIGTPAPGVRNYTIGQLIDIWQRMNSAKRVRVPSAMREALPPEEIGLCRSPDDPQIPSPAEVIASHMAVVNETFSNPDASTQSVALSGLGRGRGFGRPNYSSGGSFPDKDSNGGFGSPVHQEQPARSVEPWRPPSMNGASLGTAKPTVSEPKTSAVPGSMLELSSSLSSRVPTQGPLYPVAVHGSPTKGSQPAIMNSLTPESLAILMGGDQWVYRDPQGNIQGPFTKQDLLDWFEAGFFPKDLAIRSMLYPPHAPFLPLFVALPVWLSHIQLHQNMPPGFGLAPDALVAQLVKMASSSVGDVAMSQQQQRQTGGQVQLQQHPDHGQEQPVHTIPVPSLPLEREEGAKTLAQPLQQLAVHGVMQHAPGVQQLPESILQDLGSMTLSSVFQGGEFQPDALNHVLEPPASSVPLPSHVTPSLQPPRAVQAQEITSAWTRTPQQLGASLSHIQKEQVLESASEKAAEPPVMSQNNFNLPDDDDLLFPMPPSVESQQTRPQPAPSQPAIVAPRKKTPAVVAASTVPTSAPISKPSSVQPTQQFVSESEPQEYVPQPVPHRPETKVAPWASAATAQQTPGRSLADIQREEQQRAASLAAEASNAPAVAVPIAQTHVVTGWSNVAKAGLPQPQQVASPRQMHIQEDVRVRQQQQQQQQLHQQNQAANVRPASSIPVNVAGATPSGITLADMIPQSSGAKPASAWGGNGANFGSSYDEETPADLEGGVDEEGLDDALAAFFRHQQQQQQQQQNQPPAPVPGKGKSIKEIQREELLRQRQAEAPVLRQQPPPTDTGLFTDADSGPAAQSVGGEGLAARSSAFIDWCKEQMLALTGKTDLTLIEFLLTLASGGEVAEYTQMYLGSNAKVSTFTAEFIRRKHDDIKAGGSASKKAKKKAAQAIATSATPVAEQRGAPPILPPRAAPQQQQAAPVRAAAMPATRPAAAHAGIARNMSAPQPAPQKVASAGPPSGGNNAAPTAWPSLASGPGSTPAPAPVQSPMLSSMGSSPLPTPSRPAAASTETGGTGKGKKGKKGKGQKVDLSLLGFSTGTDYSALEKPER